MLLNLHVKNLALINEVEVNFKDNLNILTGETGAGKSIIIGSVNIALGGKFSKDMVRDDQVPALVELLFQIDDQKIKSHLKEIDIILSQDGQLLITRKMINGRSICKINGETVTVNKIKDIAEVLIDIHGQHEHQSLLYKSKHLEILDRFAHKDIIDIKEKVEKAYEDYNRLLTQLNKDTLEEESRIRELNFTQYVIKEIEEANLLLGEDEELSTKFKKMSNSKQIVEVLTNIYSYTGYDNDIAAGDGIGRGLKAIGQIEGLDKNLEGLKNQLETIDNLLNDFNRDLSDYMQDMTFDDETFKETEERLNDINGLKLKYGNTIEKILEYKEAMILKYEKLFDYETYIANLKNQCEITKAYLKEQCILLSKARQKAAVFLIKKIKHSLTDLNFLDVSFDMEFKELEYFSKNGMDEACFMISTNPGERLRPLHEVASGGELSRIMLAIKTVLADEDAIHTLIFDEIDVGISGRTAQKVSEKLVMLSRHHQVICITHLAQIAAMADAHYIIEKTIKNEKTVTSIRQLNEDDSILELARITGGVEITDRVLQSAKEMKELASTTKLY